MLNKLVEREVSLAIAVLINTTIKEKRWKNKYTLEKRCETLQQSLRGS